MSYFSDRLKEYGITDSMNTYKAEFGEGRAISQWKFFTETEKGDIEIGYLDPEGFIYQYHDDSVNQGRDIKAFTRIRHANPKEDKNGKKVRYSQPAKTGTYPFITPTVLECYKKKKFDNDTLYLVEGEFKAFRLSIENIPCIGIGGIWNFKNDKKGDIHEDIGKIITECGVRRVVMIQDRDCMEIKYSDTKNLDERPRQFYNALVKFNQYLAQFKDVAMFFCWVSENNKDTVDEDGKVLVSRKGIDDLMNAEKVLVPTILSELKKFATDSKKQFINSIAMLGNGSNLQALFGLDHVENFYELHKEEIARREFNYRNERYFINSEDKVQRSWQGQQKHYVRVGTEYYKKIVEKEPNGQVELNLVPWTTEAIKTDFSNSKEFIKQIPKYDGFTNIPDNNPDSYQEKIFSHKDGYSSVLYNRYCPVSHVPKEGEWRTINSLLHHIFDYKCLNGQTCYDMVLDYLQLIYTKPTQHLPILCLVSKERETGKTTFLNLLRSIFMENTRILDSDRIASKFNGSWAGKLLVCVDESFIDTDKPTVVNRLKMIATNNSIPLEKKGKDAGEIPNFAKLIMCSNDENNFLKIELEETRYWIIKVGSIPKDKRDPHMLDKMEAEIPAFLHYLKNRTLYYSERTRLWFDPSDYRTDMLARIQERSQSRYWKAISAIIIYQFKSIKKSSIRLRCEDISDFYYNNEHFRKPYGTLPLDVDRVRENLRDHGFNSMESAQDYCWFPMEDGIEQRVVNKRAYKFSVDQFFNEGFTDEDWYEIINDVPDQFKKETSF